jgi:hypothetical protein
MARVEVSKRISWIDGGTTQRTLLLVIERPKRLVILLIDQLAPLPSQLPGDDVAGEVVEDRREVEPSPANDLDEPA